MESSSYPHFDIEAFFIQRGIDWNTHSSGDHTERATNCPSCHLRGEPTPDIHKKLWINVEKGTFYCYRCNWSGSLIKLIQKVMNTSYLNVIKTLKGTPLDILDHMDLKLNLERREPDLTTDAILRDVELPYGYEPIDSPHPYLEKRGIPWKYAQKYDWGVSVSGYTKDRIIVPTFMDGRIVFWQARWTGKDDKDIKKVLNPKGVSARGVLYNFDVATKYKTVIIVEGFIDAVKTGSDAVATNGKRIHPEQLEFLKDAGVESLVLMWDRDAFSDGKEKKLSSVDTALSLIRAYGFGVKVVRLPDERDPGSYPYRSEELRRFIDEAVSKE